MQTKNYNKTKGQKLTPGGRIFISVWFLLFALLVAGWKLWDFPFFEYSDLFIFCISFFIGLYLLLTCKRYKRKYYPDRKFSQPVSPDGSQLVDNSEYLEELIFEEAHKNPPLYHDKTFVRAVSAFIIFVLFVLLDTRFFTSLPDTNLHPVILPLAFISLSSIVMRLVFSRESKIKLICKILQLIVVLVPVMIITISLIFAYSDFELTAYFSAVFTIIVASLLIYKYLKSIRVEDEDDMNVK